jgi:hypothetical protein
MGEVKTHASRARPLDEYNGTRVHKSLGDIEGADLWSFGRPPPPARSRTGTPVDGTQTGERSRPGSQLSTRRMKVNTRMRETIRRAWDGIFWRGSDRVCVTATREGRRAFGVTWTPASRPNQRREWPPSTRSLSSAKQWCRARGLAQTARQRGPDDWQKPAAATDDWLNGRAGFRVRVAWLLVANTGRDASAQADLVGGVFGLRCGEFTAVFGRELFGQPLA